MNDPREKREGARNLSAPAAILAAATFWGLAAVSAQVWTASYQDFPGCVRDPQNGAVRLEPHARAGRPADCPPRLAFIAGEPMDLNRAALADLLIIPGVGPKTAAAVVSARRRRGGFQSPADLDAIDGLPHQARQGLRRWTMIAKEGTTHAD